MSYFVDVGILNWNGLKHLKPCLDALSEQRDPGVDWRIVVFDNGSTDGSREWLAALDLPRLVVVESERNLGFCGGYNRLIEESPADAIALLNNDTRPQPEWLAELVAALRCAPEDVAAVSGLIVDWEGERLDFARGAMTFDGHAFQLDYHRPLDEVTLPADGEELLFACGGNMLIRRQSFLAAGGFDPRYFAYLEDVDLGWRLWSGGERVLLARRAVVHHRSMATSDLLGVYNRGFLFERNAFLTAYKNYDAELWPRLLPAVMMTLLARTQTLLVQNNPGGELLTIDPYAIPSSAREAQPATRQDAPVERRPVLPLRLLRRWREMGSRQFARHVVDRFLPPQAATTLDDPRTVAQFRAITYLLGDLDALASARRQVQARRRRDDRELFERFPLLVVPTYPGDEKLFGSAGFCEWLPADLPIRRANLEEIMDA
ncbi:MAG: glycosyltransferase family 2 protein [Acidobacteriota bacterium]